MIDEVLDFWFGTPAQTTDELMVKMRRWFMGGPPLDAEIRERFSALVERALAGELDGWPQTTRGRLALILLLDQFTRSIYRDDPRMYAGDPKALGLALEAFDRGLERELSIEERQFLGMPLVHCEDLPTHHRSVEVVDSLVRDAADFQKPILAMGTEQSRKYRDVITRFGRFPHRNALLGRPSTAEEEAFLLDWAARMPPAAAKNL